MCGVQRSLLSVKPWRQTNARSKRASRSTSTSTDIVPTRSLLAEHQSRVYFSEVAELTEAPGSSKIIRSDQKRSITVLADVDEKEGNTLQITNQVRKRFANLQARYPGYKLEFKGQRQQIEESFQDLIKSFLIAVLLIYLILGALFKSYIQPLVVMLAIPFAANGVIVGHAFMGLSFQRVHDWVEVVRAA